MLSNCESTTSHYYVMFGAGAVFFFRLRQKSAKEPAPAPQRWLGQDGLKKGNTKTYGW